MPVTGSYSARARSACDSDRAHLRSRLLRTRVVLGKAGGTIAYRFHARDAHLVLSPGTEEPIPFRVLLDGELPGRPDGVDVAEDGSGVLRNGRRTTSCARTTRVRERTLEITFLEPGAEVYAFTFG